MTGRAGRAATVTAGVSLAAATLMGCVGEELNRWGAARRGAPVTVSYKGHPNYVTGPAGNPNVDGVLTFEECKALAIVDQGVPDHLGPLICAVNRGWVEGQHGHDTD